MSQQQFFGSGGAIPGETGFSGSVTTTDDTPDVLLVEIPMTNNPGVYQFTMSVVFFDITNNRGGTSTIVASYRLDGASAVALPTPNYIDAEDPDEELIEPLEVAIELQTTPGFLEVNVTGLAATTINWKCSGYYVFVN